MELPAIRSGAGVPVKRKAVYLQHTVDSHAEKSLLIFFVFAGMIISNQDLVNRNLRNEEAILCS